MSLKCLQRVPILEGIGGDLKRKLTKEGFNQLYEIIVQLKLASTDGKRHTTDCADAKGLLCIIQSISFPKAEPFKSRLTPKVGAEMTGGDRRL